MNRALEASLAVAALLLAVPPVAARAEARTTVFISDLHMGIGRDDAGAWHPTEDFRWPNALAAFLEAVSREGDGHTDLVIVGDFLELWQPPPGVACQGPDADHGCTLDEMAQILRAVIAAHPDELAALAHFAQEGSNRLYVIPGNHDAALTVDELWAPVAEALGGGERVQRVADGLWSSDDGAIFAEHGHQIGWDPNRYGSWPSVTETVDGTVYIRRPWGENFVQALFNAEESTYPIIDNLSPSSAGARYRMADRGVVRSALDVARFLKFNLLETSLGQKIAVLGEEAPEGPVEWNLAFAREELGHELFLGALAPSDALACHIRAGDAPEWQAVRSELDALARDREALPDAEVEALCDKLAARGAERLCRDPALGSVVEGAFRSREEVVTPHVKERQADRTAMRTFVYGHTHAYEAEWPVRVSDFVVVSVLNDGAFQRVVDDDAFRALARERGLEPEAALRQIAPEELPACYTSVHVSRKDGRTQRELRAWFMEEEGEGDFVDLCDPRCARVGSGCP